MRARARVLLVAMGCFTAAGCGQIAGSRYAPESKEGMRWDYRVEYATTFGGMQTGQLVVRVAGSESIDGRRYVKEVTATSGIPGGGPETNYRRWASDGVYTVSGEHPEVGEYLATPLPLEVGTTWTIDAVPGRSTENRVEAIQDLDLIDQSYEDCLKISYTMIRNGQRFEGEQYLAPGIGVVYEAIRGPGLAFTATLTQFTK